MEDDRNRNENVEDIGRPADEEVIGTDEHFDTDDDLDEEDADEDEEMA